jgi:hypothetical protein
MMSRTGAILASGVFLVTLVAGCGESDKTPVSYKRGEYQGKPDTKPWDNAPNTWSGSTWEKGSKPSWEDAIKTRSLAQNEYLRAE